MGIDQMNVWGWLMATVLLGALGLGLRQIAVLRRSLNQLRKPIQERPTITKNEIQLAQLEKLSAIGQLAAGVAHEINNPLGIILGFAQSLVKRLPPGDITEMPLKTIEREALRCRSLVQNLLTFSRFSKADHAPVDLNRIVETTAELARTQARVKQVDVKLDLTPELPRVVANATQIEQIIINMANNSFDAMPMGGTLTIRTSWLDDRLQSWVCLHISDTGSGIPAEIRSRIFEPFFTTKSAGQGTGLGLDLVQNIVRQHSALIDVQSRPGFTEFTIRFPAAKALAPELYNTAFQDADAGKKV